MNELNRLLRIALVSFMIPFWGIVGLYWGGKVVSKPRNAVQNAAGSPIYARGLSDTHLKEIEAPKAFQTARR